MNSLLAVVTRVFAVLMIATVTGCASSDNRSQTSKTIESLSGMKTSVANAQAQVDRLIASMNAISTGNDLENSYKAFNKEVAELRAAGDRAAARGAALQEKESEYIDKWQKEIDPGKDAAERAVAEQRRNAVEENYQAAKNAGQSVRQAYGPLNGRLTDIQRSLSGNLTPQGVAQVRAVIDGAREQARDLKNRLAAFGAALDRMQAGLATSGGASAK